MSTWRILAVLTVVLTARTAWPQTTYSLQESNQAGDAFRIRLEMKLDGEQYMLSGDNLNTQKLAATALHVFNERVLALDKQGGVAKAARHYADAEVAIRSNDQSPFKTRLSTDRRLVVAQRQNEQFHCYALHGPFTQLELSLIDDHFDTLVLSQLLPGEKVKVGGTWKVPNPVVQALCAFDGVVKHSVEGKLEKIAGKNAMLKFTGAAEGIDSGSLVKVNVQASGQFAMAGRRIISLEWQQEDERDRGPVSPAGKLNTTWKVQRQVLGKIPKELSDVALIQVPDGVGTPPASFLKLTHQEAGKGYRLTYDRDWQIVLETDKHLVMRLLERGDFVSQASVAVVPPAKPGKHLSPAEFQKLVTDMPGWDAEEIRDDGELQCSEGLWIYRISSLGELDGLRVVQQFYLVAAPDGRQLVVNFVLRPAQVEKLGTRDLELVSGVEFIEE